MSLTIEATALVNAPKEHVWQILADFPNIADHVSSVKESRSTSAQPFEIGSTRSCRFSPIGSADERITDLQTGERITIEVFDNKKLPIKESTTTFTVTEVGAGTSRLTMRNLIQPKGGPFAGLVARRLRKRLPAAAQQNVEELGAAAEKIARETVAAG